MSLSLFLSSYGMARHYRPPVGSSISPCAVCSPVSQRRQTQEERPQLSQRYPLGTQNRRAVEGDTGEIRSRFHLPPAVRGVGTGRTFSQVVGGILVHAEQSGTDRLAGVFRRRELCFRKKGGAKVGKTKRGKGTKWMLLTDKTGIPIGALLDSATLAEVRLAEQLAPVVRGTPKRVIADRGYDSNRFRLFLSARGTEPIIPARGNNRKATHQDGRKLRRYRHRWVVERTFAWLGWFRCLVVRWMRKFENYLALFHLACAMISLKRVLG